MTGERPRRRLRVPQSLRGRVVFAFAVSASLVSFLLAVIMYTVGTDYVRSHPGESAARLGHVLIASVLAATLIGAAVGVWVSRRVLEPLGRISGTASRIAAGELNTRLPRSEDHDLSPTVDAFNSMVDSLQRRIERERRLVGDVSHELRTPLTTLVTSVGVLQRYADDMPERSRRALALVDDELEHLVGTLDDMLALARVEAGVHAGDTEPLSVADLLRHTLSGRKHASELLTVVEDVTISGRKLELERALANLLDNAVRHGGGITGVSVRRAGDAAVIAVDDRGPGVPVAERERIFERFATVRAGRRTATGTGIGLALVAETVAAHGGRVDCADRPGGGARFVVRLPICPDLAE
ncbi:sensor histidine kinase [Nocardia huaxiensis]|nr:HAMP domain-containing sensor histidine kinase [Nocardia huaxiensis]